MNCAFSLSGYGPSLNELLRNAELHANNGKATEISEVFIIHRILQLCFPLMTHAFLKNMMGFFSPSQKQKKRPCLKLASYSGNPVHFQYFCYCVVLGFFPNSVHHL